MKKSFLFATVLVAGLFTACSQSDQVSENGELENGGRSAVLFNFGGNMNVSTRGTGAVGDTTNNQNFWRGEKLNVYMFNQGTLDLASDVTGILFDNYEVTAPTSGDLTDRGYADYGALKYYPMNGNFDFFAYHAQSADVPQLDNALNSMVLPVTIDGSQDLMVAKAQMPNAQWNAWKSVVGKDSLRYYSAFSSRRAIGPDGLANADGVQPYFKFEHKLTRLVFYIIPNDSLVSDLNIWTNPLDPSDTKYIGVNIDSVQVSGVPTTCDFTVAWTGDAPATYLNNLTDTGTVALKQLVASQTEAFELEAFVPVQPKWNAANHKGDTLKIGESLLLNPQQVYDLQIFMSQLPNNTIAAPYSVSHSQSLNSLNMLGIQSFEEGKQYNVYFTVYGLKEIKLNVELTPWSYGGDLDVNNDLY